MGAFKMGAFKMGAFKMGAFKIMSKNAAFKIRALENDAFIFC